MAADIEISIPPRLLVNLDKSGPVPLYFQVARLIEQAIEEGDLPPGSRLENEIALGDRLGLSRPTVRRAIQELVDKGLLVRRRGIGTQVVHGPVTRNVELTSLYEDLEQTDKHPRTQVLLHELIKADQKMAEILGVELGSPILHLKRLRLADDIPVSILENFLPEIFTDISRADLEQYGLYQLIRSRGVNIKVAKQRIGARECAGNEAKLLELPRGSSVLTMDRTAYDAAGKSVEFGHHCYRPDRYSFQVTLVAK